MKPARAAVPPTAPTRPPGTVVYRHGAWYLVPAPTAGKK